MNLKEQFQEFLENVIHNENRNITDEDVTMLIKVNEEVKKIIEENDGN